MSSRSFHWWMLVAGLCLSSAAAAQNNPASPPKDGAVGALDPSGYRSAADRLIRAATETEFARDRLAELCDTFGPRFSGTTNLEAAIDWVLARMKADGLENVHGEHVLVPRWVRGEESLELLEPAHELLPML